MFYQQIRQLYKNKVQVEFMHCTDYSTVMSLKKLQRRVGCYARIGHRVVVKLKKFTDRVCTVIELQVPQHHRKIFATV